MQSTLFDQPDVSFGGRTYDPQQDKKRLTTSLEKVLALMGDGQERSLQEIANVVGCSEAGASARLRDTRKTPVRLKYGSWNLESRRVKGGLWLYRLTKV